MLVDLLGLKLNTSFLSILNFQTTKLCSWAINEDYSTSGLNQREAMFSNQFFVVGVHIKGRVINVSVK